MPKPKFLVYALYLTSKADSDSDSKEIEWNTIQKSTKNWNNVPSKFVQVSFLGSFLSGKGCKTV